ncbi:chromosome segregation protein SMC [Bifidobacterium aerophilum]|uniref:Chromosome partition protein Smc n=1 Tax=Bifidobacterium aerophilum TaxID=1798155 RepID=A0A6N9Z6P7_9BIFI|nr:chromosome segregation protein SMC [Bifidobacterium aerophilum]NEG90116.1 chromosome segregation protein SMC [Bifidobacterium aerophilum]
MYLKELTLKGFKSFASATTLRFEPGITAVVGPNGSGKSNIVDALTWVMGEQGARNLRGTSMEDVIFAGTSTRPALGRAQVSLTIDNADHALDIDYSEVTISRTIFRNGGSEYAINGTPCRLLDIQELLSDTGLGQQMHVIVGQGRLDQILRADPSGHRAFIEEAAGILKHRKRKERALRKLANTEANLARLDDLLGEIRRQLGPLGRQARVSRRADGIQINLRDARMRLYADDASRAMTQRDDAHAQLADVRGELTGLRRELAQVKVRAEQVETLTSQASPAIARINQQWHDLSRIQERLRALASLAEERERALTDQMAQVPGDDPDLLNRRADELDAQLARQRQSAQDMRLAHDKAAEERADGEKRLASIRQTIAELRLATQQRDARVANLRELIAREEAAVQLAVTRGKDFAEQRATLIRQYDEACAQRDALGLRAQAGDEDDGTQALAAARQELSSRQDALNDLQDAQRDLNGRIISLKAKADALNDTLESRNAAGSLERNPTIGAMGHLSDFIRVADGWEDAVAHALDAFAGAIVVPERRRLVRALELAREGRLGKAVALMPLPARSDDTLSDAVVPGEQASPFSAASLVTANPNAADPDQAAGVVRAVRLLLADVAAVRTLDEAIAAVDGTDESDESDGTDAAHMPVRRFSRAVTQAGEIVNPVGGVGGSMPAHSDLSLVARRDKAIRQVSELRDRLSKLNERVEQARAGRDQARRAVDQAAVMRTEIRLKTEQAASALASASERVANLDKQIRGIDDTIKTTDESRESHQLRVGDLNRALTAAQSGTDDNADADELAARERELETGLAQSREREMTAKLAWDEAERTAASLERQSGLLRDQAKAAAERRARIDEANRLRRAKADHARRIASDAHAVAELVGSAIADTSARRVRLQAEAADHDSELKTLRARRDELEPRVNELAMREHTLDVNRERFAAEYGQVAKRISDELGMNVDELIRDYGPDQPVPMLDDTGRPVSENGSDDGSGDPPTLPLSVPYVREEQVKRLERAKHDLAALGKVNPLALEEYEALQTRNQYLHEQRDDVAKSRDDLMQLIRDLDSTMIDVFRNAFDDTAAAFERVFATLFPGGTGRLRLDKPDDLLSTGVIVEASPAGKRVRQLSLLSGGERSLTALALLFAIFTARPSPFYVMDEVEAALDDVNLTRLLDAFEQLREHAQLIVITHQQRTMSIADALYGVTMRADGVTAVVSQRLAED